MSAQAPPFSHEVYFVGAGSTKFVVTNDFLARRDLEEILEVLYQQLYWSRDRGLPGFRERLQQAQHLFTRATPEQGLLLSWVRYHTPAYTPEARVRAIEDLANGARQVLSDPQCSPRGAFIASEILWLNKQLKEGEEHRALLAARAALAQGPQPAATTLFARRTIGRSSDQPQELAFTLQSAETGETSEYITLAIRSLTRLTVGTLQRAFEKVLQFHRKGIPLQSSQVANFFARTLCELLHEKRDHEAPEQRRHLAGRVFDQLERIPDCELDRCLARLRIASDAFDFDDVEVALEAIDEALEICPRGEEGSKLREQCLWLKDWIEQERFRP